MWRGNFVSGSEPSQARVNEAAVVSPKEITDHASGAADANSLVNSGGNTILTAPKPVQPRLAPRVDWVSAVGMLETLRSRSGLAVPTSMKFPDGQESNLRTWGDAQTETVKWLINTGRLTSDVCPVTTDQGTHIVHTRPVRANGKPFRRPIQFRGYWMDHNAGARDHVRLALDMLKPLGVDTSAIQFKLVSGS